MIKIGDEVSFKLGDSQVTGTVTVVSGDGDVWIDGQYLRSVETVMKITLTEPAPTSERDNLLGIHAALVAGKPYSVDPGASAPMHALAASITASVASAPSPDAGTVRCLRCGASAGLLGLACERPGGCWTAEDRVAAMEPGPSDIVEGIISYASARLAYIRREPAFSVAATGERYATRDLAIAAWREAMLERERGR